MSKNRLENEIETLKNEIKKLKRKDESRSSRALVGSIAHEFNNLLTIISGNISLSKMLVSHDDKISNLLDNAENAAKKAEELTRRLHSFSMISTPEFKSVHLNDLITKSSGFLLKETSLRCQFDFEDEMWPVLGSEGLLSMVWYDLLYDSSINMKDDNVIRISSTNCSIVEGDEVQLAIGDYVHFTYEDRVSNQRLQDILFENFQDPEEYGFNIAEIYSIIYKHYGYIYFEMKENQRIFHIYLPAATEKQGVKNDSDRGSIIFGSGKILLMDDEEMVLQTTSGMLRYLGYKVETVKDGSQLIKAFEEAFLMGLPFDMVILDLTILGGMGGLETIKKLQVKFPEVKAVLSSGYSVEKISAELKNYGFSEFVAKPFEISALSKIVHNLIMLG